MLNGLQWKMEANAGIFPACMALAATFVSSAERASTTTTRACCLARMALGHHVGGAEIAESRSGNIPLAAAKGRHLLSGFGPEKPGSC